MLKTTVMYKTTYAYIYCRCADPIVKTGLCWLVGRFYGV
jgi:hypothetical protein